MQKKAYYHININIFMSNILREAQLKVEQTKAQTELLQKKLEEAQIANQKAQQILKEAIAATQAREEEVRNEINTKIQLTNLGIEFFIELINIIPQPILNLIKSEPTSFEKKDIFLLSSLNKIQELALPNSQYTDQLVAEFNERIISSGYQFDNSESNFYILREFQEIESNQIETSSSDNAYSMENQENNLESIQNSEVINLNFELDGKEYFYQLSYEEMSEILFNKVYRGIAWTVLITFLKNIDIPKDSRELDQESQVRRGYTTNYRRTYILDLNHKFAEFKKEAHFHYLSLKEDFYRELVEWRNNHTKKILPF